MTSLRARAALIRSMHDRLSSLGRFGLPSGWFSQLWPAATPMPTRTRRSLWAAILPWSTGVPFRASVKVIPGAGFVVDRDVLYNNEQALYDYWQRELASARGQALTVDTELVNGVRRDAIWLSP